MPGGFASGGWRDGVVVITIDGRMVGKVVGTTTPLQAEITIAV
jgi:hypothetical protein